MTFLRRYFAWLTVILLFSAIGCTKPIYRLNPDARQYVKSSNTVVGVEQNEIYAQIEESNVSTYTGGGLIPALIDVGVDNYRTQRAEKLLVTIRNDLIDYDYPEALARALQERFAKVPWFHNQGIDICRDPKKDWKKQYYQKSDTSATLFVKIDYRFTPHFDRLEVAASVYLFPHSNELTAYKDSKSTKNPVADKSCIYRNGVLLVSETIGVSSIKQGATVERWADNKSQPVKDALDKTACSLANLIVEDMEKWEAK